MSTSRMPLALRALRNILWIMVVFGTMGLVLSLIGFSVMTEEEIHQETGMGRSASIALMLSTAVMLLVKAYVAASLSRGGRAQRWCVRVVAASYLLPGLVLLLVLDVTGLFDIAVGLLYLALNESRSARNWYRSRATGAAPEAAPPAAAPDADPPRAEPPVPDAPAPTP
ncbi:hypothetical protein [Nocardiopsis prasina]|uniref:hypothetical protein n=1 Tax=Nocardiopsis prasina TaxID=2015 RepID=UPI001267D436|nr:hypothetical protein [Nocardiopsis prasina]